MKYTFALVLLTSYAPNIYESAYHHSSSKCPDEVDLMYLTLKEDLEILKENVASIQETIRVMFQEKTNGTKETKIIQSKPMNGLCSSEGYKYSPDIGACFKLYTMRKTWFEANQTCTEDAASLLIIYNQSYYDAIKRLLPSDELSYSSDCGSIRDIWIGANDIEQESIFKWVNNERLTEWQKSLFNADDRSCDESVNADCALVNTGNDRWHDRDCQRFKNPFVCIRG